MSVWRTFLAFLDRVPRGFTADGRAVGLATATAIETQRRRNVLEAIEAERWTATALATDSSHRLGQHEHGRHPG